MRSYPKEPDPVPCPTCYLPMKRTPEGMACEKHGIPVSKRKRKAAARETTAVFAFILCMMLVAYASAFAFAWLTGLMGGEPWSFTPISV